MDSGVPFFTLDSKQQTTSLIRLSINVIYFGDEMVQKKTQKNYRLFQVYTKIAGILLEIFLLAAITTLSVTS